MAYLIFEPIENLKGNFKLTQRLKTLKDYLFTIFLGILLPELIKM